MLKNRITKFRRLIKNKYRTTLTNYHLKTKKNDMFLSSTKLQLNYKDTIVKRTDSIFRLKKKNCSIIIVLQKIEYIL